MLENAVQACPDELWGDRSQHLQFWYIAYHALFWLDLNLSGTTEGFAPPPPFTLSELDPSGTLPERVYTKAEILGYLEYERAKSRETIQTLTDERMHVSWRFPWWREAMSLGEVLLFTMRHVQEHAAQLGLLLGQTDNLPPGWDDWVGRAKGG